MTLTAYIITKPASEGECKWCALAWTLLESQWPGMAMPVELPLPLPARMAYQKGSGTKTIPQIYMVDEDGFSEHIGGYEELVAWLEKRNAK